MSILPNGRRAGVAALLVLAGLLFVAGGLIASPGWRMAALRLTVPGVPDAPVLPLETVSYGTRNDRSLEFLELAVRPADEAIRQELLPEHPRLRAFRYLWPRDVAVGFAFKREDEPRGSLFAAVSAAAEAAGWREMEQLRHAYFGASTLAFRKNGHVFAVVAGSPHMSEVLTGRGRVVRVRVFGAPPPVEGERRSEYLPLFVLTDTFDPDGASYPVSVIAPFVHPDSKVRMERPESRDAVVVDRATFRKTCLEPGGLRLQRPYAPCVVR